LLHVSYLDGNANLKKPNDALKDKYLCLYYISSCYLVAAHVKEVGKTSPLQSLTPHLQVPGERHAHVDGTWQAWSAQRAA